MSDPIVVDIGHAIQQLQSDPGLAQKLNELAFGQFAAGQLAARGALIMQLGEALAEVNEHYGEDSDVFCKVRAALVEFNEYKASA
ncbi:hypothetical protein EHS39_11405 [Ensifer sp. MPMI2T]|nr:hypothetical protein EHS39_11405 [Ensifer sp. MPMI2T]